MKERMVQFLERAVDDPVLGPSHISLYAALLQLFQEQNRNPISVYRRDLVRWSKISHRAYHKCIRDLAEGGYVDYLPSYDPYLGSLVYFKIMEPQ